MAPESDFPLSHEEFDTISRLLYDLSGISLGNTKQALVHSRLTKRLRSLGLQSFSEYCALISSRSGSDERMRMMAALTTNVTHFFREPHHFELLKSRLMPSLAEKARRGGRVRIWSAGCSNGHEPYSIALTILDVLPDAAVARHPHSRQRHRSQRRRLRTGGNLRRGVHRKRAGETAEPMVQASLALGRGAVLVGAGTAQVWSPSAS